MKIVVSMMNSEKDGMMDQRFGRCAFFAAYDTESKEITFVENEGLNATGGAGIKAANSIIDMDANVLITGHLGPNASDVLKASDVKLYTSPSKKLSEVIKDYEENKLSELTEVGPSKAGIR